MTTPRRILHVCGSMAPAAGGPPKIAISLAAAQAAHGHEVRLICNELGDSEGAPSPVIADTPGVDRVDVQRVNPPRFAQLLGITPAPAPIAKHVGWADVVHLHSVWDPVLPVAARVARRLGKPYLILLNGMLDPWSLSQSALKKRVALRLVYRAMLNGAAALHLGNTDERDLIARLGLTTRHVIVPNGVFLEEIEPLPAPGTFRAQHPELGDRPFVLFLSRLHYKKGLDILAEAFGRFAADTPGVDLVVAGPDEGYRQVFLDRVNGLGLAERVHVVGPVYGPDKYGALVDAECFCLPSRQEGFSVAITEALACGCVPVITEGCHFPEVAEAEAGYVTPLDPEAVADALRAVLRDPDDTRARGQRARELVEARYTWPVIARGLVQHYQDLSR